MSGPVRELLERALKLPPEGRAELVAELMASLESGYDDPATVEAAWSKEISRRVRELLAGGDRGAPADEVIARFRAKYGV